MMTIMIAVDRALARVLGVARWLALPLALLLFLQWPLRELVQGGSRQANDLGQCVFALYIALAITDATRRGSHLAPRPLAPGWAQRWRTVLRGAGIVVGLLPWSMFVLITSGGQVRQSVLQLESFPDTGNPGYFLVKMALWLLAGAMTTQAVLDLSRLHRGEVR